MPTYLLDTNILVRLVDPAAKTHALAVQAVSQLLGRGEPCVLAPQVLVEFWSVATRPVAANGLGWDVPRTRAEVNQLLSQFPLLQESPGVFALWLNLATSQAACGKRVHDLRIVALMQSHEISHLLTFNVTDFPPVTGVRAVHPDAIP